MLNRAGLDLNKKADTNYNTAVHLAAQLPEPELLILLLEHGGDVNVVNKYGHTPVDVALIKGSLRHLEALCEAGANLNGHGSEKSPLRRAITGRDFRPHKNMDTRSLEYARLIGVLLEYGAGIGFDFGNGEFFDTTVQSHQISLAGVCLVGAICNGQSLNSSSARRLVAILSHRDLEGLELGDGRIYHHWFRRLEELKSVLSAEAYSSFMPLENVLSQKIWNSEEPRWSLPSGLRDKDQRINVEERRKLFKERQAALKRLIQRLPDNVNTKIDERLGTMIISIVGTVFGAIGVIIPASLLSYDFLTIQNGTSEVSVDCWDVVRSGTYDKYKNEESYPGCGPLFDVFLISSILLVVFPLVLLVTLSPTFFRSRRTYLDLKEFQAHTGERDFVNTILPEPSKKVVRLCLNNAEKPANDLDAMYDRCLHRLEEVHPHYRKNEGHLLEGSPTEPGYTPLLEVAVSQKDDPDSSKNALL